MDKHSFSQFDTDLEAIARPLTAEDADEETEETAEAGERGADQSRRQKLRPGPGSAGVYAPWPSVSSRDVPPEVSGNEVQGIIDVVRDTTAVPVEAGTAGILPSGLPELLSIAAVLLARPWRTPAPAAQEVAA